MPERERYRKQAAELVEANAQRYPDLLAEQLGTAMFEAARATTAAYEMRMLVAVCMRLVARADVKPKGDEKVAVKLAEGLSHCMPGRNGGNGWFDADQLAAQLIDVLVRRLTGRSETP